MSDMLRSLLSNLATLAISLVLATIIWVNAVQGDDPVRSQFMQVPVQFVGLAETNRLLSPTQQTVQIMFEGRSSLLRQITSDEFRAVADLSSVPFGQETAVAIDVTSDINGIRILSQSPEQVDVLVDQLMTRNIPVELEVRGTVARGHEPGEPLIEPETITVSGTASQIEPLDFARITVFLSNDRETIVVRPQPIIYNRQGRIVSTSGLDLSTEQVQVTIPVNETAGVAEKLITVSWIGEPAPGYRLLSVEVNPPSVLVEGLPTQLTRLNRVQTELIDVTGLEETFQQQVVLDLPNGISLVEVEEIFVTIEIEPLLTTSIYTLQPELQRLDPNLQASVSPEEVQIVLFGPLPVLNTLLEDEVSVKLDLLGLGIGTYNLPPLVDFPERGIELRSIQPNLISVEITELITITDTITDTEALRLPLFGEQHPVSSIPYPVDSGELTISGTPFTPYALRTTYGKPI
ncbi:MAG: CdaR family protein [Chloroflexota bacterium]